MPLPVKIFLRERWAELVSTAVTLTIKFTQHRWNSPQAVWLIMSGGHMQHYDLKGTTGMNEFGDNKTNREEERGNALKPNAAQAHSTSIGALLHRRYDGTLSETLPDSFVSLLKELDRKLPGQTKR